MSGANKFRIVDAWFDTQFGSKPAGRLSTWKISLAVFLHNGGGLMLETGCQRQEEDWGAGCSTLILAKFLKEFQAGKLHTVDITPGYIELARNVARKHAVEDVVSFHVADSVPFLESFPHAIDFLYLDSFDWFPNEPMLTQCQEHQLRELKACYPKLKPKTIVLLDDNNLPDGGKTRLTKQFLSHAGWKCVMDQQQSLWTRC